MVTEVIKRDGNVEEFKPYKIDNVIELAFNNVNESYDRSVFDNVLKILKKSESKVLVEHIQDIIETQLYKKKHFEVLKSFIEYRQTHKVQRFLKKDKTTFVDCNQTIDEYVDKVDWRILANSNTGYSHAGLVNNTAGKVIANYWLDKVYSPEEAKAHRDGDYHIHDLDNLSGYCAGWSLRALLDEGFNGVRGRVDADAPNHLSSALGQMVNFLGILQSEWAGAQAFSSFDTYLAPYLFKDCLTDEQLYKEMQSFVYNLNVPSRWGQSPFTNVTIDVTVPEDLKNQIPTRKQRHIFSDIDANSDLGKKLLKECKKRGKEKLIDMTYSDFQLELERIDIAFYKVLTEGDLHSQPFTFPIPTVNITEDFDWDSKAANAIFENAAKMGSSYFQNFIGSQYIINENGERVPNEKAYKPGAVRSMCVTPDTKILVRTGKNKEEITIGEFVENPKYKDSEVRTSKGYSKPSKIFKYKINEKIVKITLDDGTILKLTKDHPSLVYFNNTLKVVKSEFLSAGMQVSMKHIPSKESIEKMRNTKILGFKNGTYKKLVGELNPMFGKKHSDLVKEKISKNMKNHFVSDLCKSKSSERWKGLKNPVANQNYWDRKDFKVNNMQISPLEKIIYDELKSLDVNFDFQKVFKDLKNNKTYVADFYIPEKNTVLELESKLDEKVYINELPKKFNKEKFDFYQSQNINVISFNPEKCNTYRIHINNVATIENVEFIDYEGYVYDFETENHNFYVNNILTHNCCRLQLDLRELLKRGGGLFGSAEMTGCYDDQTEILTDSGWKYFKDLNGSETVLTMNSNKDISWNKIEQLHQYDIDDNMYHFKRRNITEMVVTPNHRMLVSDKKGAKFEIKRADEVFKSKKEYIVPKNNAIKQNISKSIKIGSLEFDTIVFYRFLGAYLGDGSFVYNENTKTHKYNVNIAQKDTDKNFESIKKIVDAMNMKYTYSSGCFNIYNKELANYMKQFGKAHDKFVPKELFLEDSLVINAFLEGFRLTDYCNKYFYTCSPQLKDDLQVLLQLVGISSRARIHKKHPFTVDFGNGRAAHSNYDLWEICEHRTRSKSFMKSKLEIKRYKGKVYCVTVPNNTVCVRRNGNVNWSGNSIGVVTINLARLGYLFKGDSEGLYKRLDYLMDLAKSTLIKKRAVVQELFDRGLFPYTKRYLPGFNNHFSTIGVNGANEMIRNFTNDKESIVTEFGQKFAYDLLEHMRARIREFQESTGYLFNLEATPAEGTTYRFAKEDLKRYPDILQAGFGNNIYYTNSTQIPTNYTDDVFEALELNDALQCEYTGGTVLHMYMANKLADGEEAKNLIKKAISNFRLPYLTITPVFSICPKHGYISGDHEFCPKCDAELLEQQNRSCGNDC